MNFRPGFATGMYAAAKDISLACVQTSSGTSQPPIQWVPLIISWWGGGRKLGRGLTLTIRPIQCRGEECVGVILPLPLISSMVVAGRLCLYAYVRMYVHTYYLCVCACNFMCSLQVGVYVRLRFIGNENSRFIAI
jgi:hypothetical protein